MDITKKIINALEKAGAKRPSSILFVSILFN